MTLAARLAAVLAMFILMPPIERGGAVTHGGHATSVLEMLSHPLAAVADHCHAHHAVGCDEDQPRHAHGNNPADHSHETAGEVTYLQLHSHRLSEAWVTIDLDLPHLSLETSLERPPRPLLYR